MAINFSPLDPFPIRFVPGVGTEVEGRYLQCKKELLKLGQGIHVTCDDETRSFSFRHQEQEIYWILMQAKLQTLIASQFSIRKPSRVYDMTRYSVDPSVYNRFREREKELCAKARDFFKKFYYAPCSYTLSKRIPFHEQVLKKFSGFCVGESHADKASKRYLIKHMIDFKKAGVDTLFLERICDTMQEALDSKDSLPPYVVSYLKEESDRGFEKSEEPTTLSLVIKARECGIRVVGLDSVVSLSPSDLYTTSEDKSLRTHCFNFTAYHIWKKEKPTKYIALMGNTHLENFEGALGLSNLLGCPSLLVSSSEDSFLEYPKEWKSPRLVVNKKGEETLY